MNIDIKTPLAVVRNILLNPDIVLRLNPSWYVKEIKAADKDLYALTLYDDRADETYSIFINIEASEKSINYKINSNKIEFLMDEIKPSVTRISVKGDFFKEADLPYWLKGLKNYIQLETKQSRIMKWFFDRFWLRMTPSQRRIAMMVIIAEGIGFIALIIVIVALKLFK